MMWETIAALGVPLLTLIGSLINRSGNSLSKRIAHHATVAEKLKPMSTAYEGMSRLIEAEVAALAAREGARASRKLNVSNMILSLILAAITAGAIYLSFNLWRYASDGVWHWIAAMALSVVAFFFVILSAAGFGTLYNPTKTQAERNAEKAEKERRKPSGS